MQQSRKRRILDVECKDNTKGLEAAEKAGGSDGPKEEDMSDCRHLAGVNTKHLARHDGASKE